MRNVYIAGGVRTPIGKYGGALRGVRPDDLAAHAIRKLVERTGVQPSAIDDVFLGDANQAGEDNRNVARMAALLAGLPVSVPGTTVNRLCGSGLQAVVSAAREIQVGSADAIIAGGVESMTRAPFVLLKPDAAFGRGNREMFDTTLGWRMINPRLAERFQPVSLGQTAENVAERYGISRVAQDEFALRSHRLAAAAQDAGRFGEEIIAIDVQAQKGPTMSVEMDEGPRRDTSLAKLAALPPAFASNGTVTAGNSSQLNDGAVALLLVSEEALKRLEVSPLARFIDAATVGVDPAYMGIGPVPATKKLLERHGIESRDVDFFEVNEAFAAQALACIQELGLRSETVNRNGGAIALGHPLGASGARLATTLAYELRGSGASLGIATMCIGVGQGISALFESAGSAR